MSTVPRTQEEDPTLDRHRSASARALRIWPTVPASQGWYPDAKSYVMRPERPIVQNRFSLPPPTITPSLHQVARLPTLRMTSTLSSAACLITSSPSVDAASSMMQAQKMNLSAILAGCVVQNMYVTSLYSVRALASRALAERKATSFYGNCFFLVWRYLSRDGRADSRWFVACVSIQCTSHSFTSTSHKRLMREHR